MFVFYATGYRYDFFAEQPAITTTGGLYVSAEAENSEIYLDEEEVKNLRVFRNAAYIQSLVPGLHRLHVQAPGLQTWVKELPVHGQIVTEASSFNLPEVSQVRPITEYVTVSGEAVYVGVASTSLPFQAASTTIPLLATSTTATSSFLLNPEFEFIESLFATTSTTTGLVGRVIEGVVEAFRFSSEATTTTALATSSIVFEDLKLFEKDGEVYAGYTGALEDIPYYFCIPFGQNASTSALYGDHIVALLSEAVEVAERSVNELSNEERLCRSEIRIDRKWQAVSQFAFYPGSSDLVIMVLEDGVHIVEIDDRAWQNTQMLYAGTDLEVAVDGGQIFIKDGPYYLEALTELPEA